MAIAGGAKPSARVTLIKNVVVVDSFLTRQSAVISTVEEAIELLHAGKSAYVQAYGDNLQRVRNAFAKENNPHTLME